LLLVAPVFYGVFYPQPYLGQLVRKIPIAVVDDDRTVLSRRLIQALDADEAISVAVRAPALDVAQQALFDRRVFGILEIPPDIEREVLKGNKARIPAYVDSAYFLVFNRTLQGIPFRANRRSTVWCASQMGAPPPRSGHGTQPRCQPMRHLSGAGCSAVNPLRAAAHAS